MYIPEASFRAPHLSIAEAFLPEGTSAQQTSPLGPEYTVKKFPKIH
jgi:hypothetical protein